MAGTYSNAVLADAPAAYYRLNEISGTVAVDSSGNGRNGIYRNGATTGAAGALGSGDFSVSLDGLDDYVELPGSWGAGWTGVTVEAWIKLRSTKGNFQGICYDRYASTFMHFQTGDYGENRIYLNDGTPETKFTYQPLLPKSPIGTWRHVAIVGKSGRSEIFVDGVPFGSADSTTFSSIAPATILGIGGIPEFADRYFDGYIDEVAIYSAALTQARIQAHIAARADDSSTGSDPGQTSKLTLVTGTVAGQAVSPSNRTVTVTPGQSLVGQINVRIDSTWPSNAVMAMGLTPSWGSHATSYSDIGGFATPVSGLTRTVPINLTAPTTPGTYYITSAYRGEFTAAQVMSCTSWAVGAGTWNDGNDVADWTASMISSTNANGTVQASVLYPAGFATYYVPATAITVIVQAPTTCSSFTISPSSASPSNQAGSTTVSLTGSPSGCQGGTWTASGNGSWLTVSPTAGTGSGNVTVSWSANTATSQRTGNATIAGRSFSVNQAGVVPTADPGQTSKLTLVSGTVAGQSVSPSNRTVIVGPGQSLAGQLNVRIDSTWASNAVMAMGITPSWGTHATSFTDLGGFATPVSGLTRTVPINLTAPSTPGTYHITSAYRGEFTAAQVMSCTSWSVGAGTWNDGNDVADWTASMISETNANGTVQASVLYPAGFSPYYVPATAITVVVQNPPGGGGQLAIGSGSLCSGQSVTIPVTLTGTNNPLAIQFDTLFDSSKLSVKSVQTGSLTAGFSVSSNGTSGRVRVAMASGSAASAATGEVARITFQATSALGQGGSAGVEIENVTINDIAGTGTTGTLTCPSCRKGDVNGNGAVSAYDASMVLQAVVGAISLNSSQACAADFNTSGSVTAYDASLILQCVVSGNCP